MEEYNNIKKKLLKGTLWTVLGQLGTLIISLGANIIIARKLGLEEYGTLGIIMFFISIAEVLNEGGLSGAIIRNPKSTEKDYATVFICNFLISLLTFLLIFLFSHKIATFYNDDSLSLPLIISAFVLIFNALQMVQNTKLMAEMAYGRKAIYDIVAIGISSIVGISLAYLEYGIWALVFMLLTKSIVKAILLWTLEQFFFKLSFSKESFIRLYGFGVNTTITSVISMVFDNIYQLVIGKVFSIATVGLYYQAKKLQDVFNNTFFTFSQSVFFSALSKTQDDKDVFSNMYNQVCSYIISILGVATLITYTYSSEIMVLLFGNKWLDSGFYLRFLCIASFFLILENTNRIVYKTVNRTRKLLVLEVVKKTFQAISIVVGVYFKDISVLLVGFVVSSALGYYLSSHLSKKYLSQSIYRGGYNSFLVFITTLFLIFITTFVRSIFNLQIWHIIILTIVELFIYILLIDMFKIINIRKIICIYKNKKV